VKALAANLAAGLRVLVFQRTTLAAFRPSADQWVALAILQAGCLLAGDYLRMPADAELNVFAFADYGLLLVALMLSGYLLGRLWRDRALALAVPVVVVSVVLPFSVAAELAIWWWDEAQVERDWAVALLAAWLALALLRSFYLLGGGRVGRAVAGITVAAAVWAWPLLLIGQGDFWQGAPPLALEEDLLPMPSIDGEEVMYRQPELLAAALAALQPQRSGVADTYFLGFAGDGAQQVFAKEASYARAIWDRRYDSRGRSLLLVNDPDTVDELPIASATNLRVALARLGALLNKDEDLLVLFLTSHGSREFELAVDLDPIALNPLTPAELKRDLDEAGIKWRIIIVSACYAGGYVAPLRDPYTIVMTAAASDRTSFGCDTDRDFTYFGEAYFRDALAQGVPLLDAFRQAASHIREREQREGLTPSLPQLEVGAEIAARLPVWEARWRKSECIPAGTTC